MSDIIDIRTRQAKPKPDAVKATPPWFRFFARDWLAKTMGLSAAETGILITLVAEMHVRGEPTPENHARLARLCRVPTRNFRRSLDQLLTEGLVIRVAGGLWSPMIQSEIDHRRKRGEAQQSGDMSVQKSNVMSGESSIKTMPENDRVSESQSLREREGGLQPPLSQISTFEGSRDAQESAPLSHPKPESPTFRVGAVVDVDGDACALEYQQQDGCWRARSLASGDYRSLAVDLNGDLVAGEPDDVPF